MPRALALPLLLLATLPIGEPRPLPCLPSTEPSLPLPTSPYSSSPLRFASFHSLPSPRCVAFTPSRCHDGDLRNCLTRLRGGAESEVPSEQAQATAVEDDGSEVLQREGQRAPSKDGAETGQEPTRGGEDEVEDEMQYASELRREAALEGKAGRWEEACALYKRACAALESLVPQEPSDKPAAVERELQSLRLNCALCQIKLEQWGDAISSCTEVLKHSPKCGTALYRRGRALEGRGQLDAALWDLRLARKVLPGNKQVAQALQRVEEAQQSLPVPQQASSAAGGPGGAGARAGPLEDGTPRFIAAHRIASLPYLLCVSLRG